MTKEPTVPDEKTPPQVATFRINSVPTTDVATIQSYIDELEKRTVSAGPLKFRFGTEEIQDPGEVQKHIDVLQQFHADLVVSERAEFVKKLATENKLAAPQIDSETAFVQTLSADQFATYRKARDEAPATPGLGD